MAFFTEDPCHTLIRYTPATLKLYLEVTVVNFPFPHRVLVGENFKLKSKCMTFFTEDPCHHGHTIIRYTPAALKLHLEVKVVNFSFPHRALVGDSRICPDHQCSIKKLTVAVHRGVMMADTLSFNAKIGVVNF